MRLYSDLLKKPFDTEEELIEAEAKENERLSVIELEKTERVEAAKAVQAALDECQEAYKKYAQLRNDFISKYGGYHMTYKTKIDIPTFNSFANVVSEMLDNMFKFW